METDYYQRMVEEHKEEIGLFGRIDAPKFLDPQLMESTQEGKDHQAQLQNYLSNRLKDYIESDSIIEEIDAEIKTITEGEKND